MTIDICSQDFFIYVPTKEKDCETLSPLASEWDEWKSLHADYPAVDESWVKISLQDQLVIYARLGNDVDA
ncbi:MAG TPA: hypothetical protein VGN34_18325 [Ktedonobacteraceae bacterium]|jgi:hypothetical protein